MGKKYKVKKFVYDGLMIQGFNELAPYEVEFHEWTKDPGIMACKDNEGNIRLIPICQLVGFNKDDVPRQEYKSADELGVPVLLGMPSAWDKTFRED